MADQSLQEIIEKARAKRFSLPDLAREAEVSRATLYRWKNGEGRPRLEEFLRLSNVLGLTPLDEHYGIALLAHPQAGDEIAWRIARDEAIRFRRPVPPRPAGNKQAERFPTPKQGSPTTEKEPTLWRPGMGDILLAMRRRAGLSSAEVARRLGVTEFRMSRWLHSLVPVPEEDLGALLQALEANEQEATFLREHKGYRDSCCWAGTATLHEAVEQHIQVNDRQQAGEDLLGDLEYLVVENRLWPHALENAGAREVLALSYYNHGMWLKNAGRLKEADEFAERSRQMALNVKGMGKAKRSHWWSHSVIMHAWSLSRRSRRLAIEELQRFEGDTMPARFVEYFHREFADLYSLAGDFGKAEHHIQIALHAASTMEERFFNVVKRSYAQILLRQNQPGKALDWIPDVEAGPPPYQVRCLVLQIAALQRLGAAAAGQEQHQLAELLAQHSHLQALVPVGILPDTAGVPPERQRIGQEASKRSSCWTG